MTLFPPLILRLLAAFLTGYLYAISGLYIQQSTQNPLAGPSTLGQHAVLSLISLLFFFLMPLNGNLYAYLLSLLFAFFVFLVAFKQGNKLPKVYRNRITINLNSLILVGLFVNLLIGTFFAVVDFICVALNQSFPESLWFGNFRNIDQASVIILLIHVFFSKLLSHYLTRDAALMSGGFDFAASHGVNVKKCLYLGLALTFFAITPVVAFFGLFSFMGLLFPQIVKTIPFLKNDFNTHLKWGPWICGFILMFLDFMCWYFPVFGAEIPVGLVTTLLGTGFLTFILGKRWYVREERGES